MFKMPSNKLTIFLFLLISCINALEVGDACVPNEELLKGVCSLVTDCDMAIRAIKNRNTHGFRRCGFNGLFEVLCCPLMSSRFGSSTTQKTTTNERIADRECRKIIEVSIPPLDLHIIGGEMASQGEFPHMVALGYEMERGKYQFDCGGSLISKNFVLTAAHCVETLAGTAPSIARLGVTELGGDRFDSATDIRISEVIIHPDYTRREKYNDMALLKLEKDTEISSSLSPICLYTGDDNIKVALTVTGWGVSNTTTNTKSGALLKANVSIVDRAECSKTFPNWRKLQQGVTNSQICAGDKNGLKDTCQGDSGGPLTGLTGRDARHRLVGVTSFGRGCGSPAPAVYSYVPAFLPWIEKTVWT